MRIDTLSQVAQLYNTSKPTRTNKTSGVAPMGKDEFQMSAAGRDFQIAKQAVAEASDIREDKVAEVKSQINSGNYNVDTEDFASVLFNAYNSRL
ncbi:MAG: flagellar biosynthesis anti-sigma factor FlgM [Lachnospiraceae bacterium]|nr:flagellar biosynthesis anti-sigma factor FlgM [Lachnospiraceae bacterium]